METEQAELIQNTVARMAADLRKLANRMETLASGFNATASPVALASEIVAEYIAQIGGTGQRLADVVRNSHVLTRK